MGTLYHAAFTHGLQTVRELDSSTQVMALELLKSVANWHLSIVFLSLSFTLMVRIAEAG
jgi:hypothetical protein